MDGSRCDCLDENSLICVINMEKPMKIRCIIMNRRLYSAALSSDRVRIVDIVVKYDATSYVLIKVPVVTAIGRKVGFNISIHSILMLLIESLLCPLRACQHVWEFTKCCQLPCRVVRRRLKVVWLSLQWVISDVWEMLDMNKRWERRMTIPF